MFLQVRPNFSCDVFSQELEKAGREASWDTLNFAFLFEKSSSLRILVSSKKVIIGSCSVSREKIVEGKKGEQGYRTVRANNKLLRMLRHHFENLTGFRGAHQWRNGTSGEIKNSVFFRLINQ